MKTDTFISSWKLLWPLLFSPDGVFVLPSSTPGFLIVEFLTGGLEEACRRMNAARSVKSEEANLIFRCINELGLIQLDRDDMISPQQMISCCSSLLKAASRIRFFEHPPVWPLKLSPGTLPMAITWLWPDTTWWGAMGWSAFPGTWSWTFYLGRESPLDRIISQCYIWPCTDEHKINIKWYGRRNTSGNLW